MPLLSVHRHSSFCDHFSNKSCTNEGVQSSCCCSFKGFIQLGNDEWQTIPFSVLVSQFNYQNNHHLGDYASFLVNEMIQFLDRENAASSYYGQMADAEVQICSSFYNSQNEICQEYWGHMIRVCKQEFHSLFTVKFSTCPIHLEILSVVYGI